MGELEKLNDEMMETENEMELHDEELEVDLHEEEPEAELHDEKIIKAESHSGDEEMLEDFNLDEIIPVKTKVVNRMIGEPGVITIINSKKNGKRIIFAGAAIDKLGNPSKLQVVFWQNGIVVGEVLPKADQFFPVKESGNKGIVYSGGLVQEITSKFNLDFSERVSITFPKVAYKDMDGHTLAFFKLTY
jgi:hypothetical protein